MIDTNHELQNQLAMLDVDLHDYILMEMERKCMSFQTALSLVEPDIYDKLMAIISLPGYDRNR